MAEFMDLDLDLEHQIVAALRKIMRAVDLHSRRLVEVCGLTGPQLAVLQEAERLGPTSATTLARAVYLSLPTVTGILGRLASRGFVQRTRDETDRRALNVSITVEGSRVLQDAPSLLQDHFRNELGRLEEWERHMMLSTLQRIAAIMGAESLEAAPHLISDGSSLSATFADQPTRDAILDAESQKKKS